MAGQPLSRKSSLTISLGILVAILGAAFHLGREITKYTISQENFNRSHAERTAKIEEKLQTIGIEVRSMQVVQETLANHQNKFAELSTSIQILRTQVDGLETEVIDGIRSRWSYLMMKSFVKDLKGTGLEIPDIEVIRAHFLYPTE